MASGQRLVLQQLRGIKVRVDRTTKMLKGDAIVALPIAIAQQIQQVSTLMAEIELALGKEASAHIQV